MRVAKDENGKAQALEVAIVRYVPAKQVKQIRQSKSGLPQARALAEQLRQVVAGLDMSGWLGGHQLTISAGVTVFAPGDTVTAALARADAALYRAKEGGRNRVEALP